MALLQNRLCTFYRRTVRLLFALVAAWLFVSCLVTTSYVSFISTEAQEVSWLCPDTTWLQCLLFSLVCLIPVTAMRNVRFSIRLQRQRSIRLLLIFIAGLLAWFWVICIQGVPRWDCACVQEAAVCIVEGNSFYFQPGRYMYIYPHQSGLLLLHLLLQKINPNTTLPFQLLNVLCYTGILYFLGELAKELGLGDTGCLTATVVGIAFLPLLFYVSFVYGTVPGLCFSLAALVLSLRFTRSAKWHQAALAPVCMFLAVAVKSNYQIFAIGLMLYLIYNGLQGRKHCWILLPLLIISWLLALKLPLLIVERLAGRSLRSGFASISWVAMGLRDGGPGGPGWFDRYTEESYYAGANMDPQMQSALAIHEIKERFHTFFTNPSYMFSFFARKNATQWSDPFFQGLWLNLLMREVVPNWAKSLLDNQGPTAFKWVMNLFQTLTYGGLVLWAWVPTNEKRKPTEDLLAVILLGGFVFHTFWEAKGQYAFPYAVLILPLALLGYRRLAALPKDPGAKALWQPLSGKIRFLMPALLMVLALVLSVVLADPLNAVLETFLDTIR